MNRLLNQMPLPRGVLWLPFEPGHLDHIDDNMAVDVGLRVVDQSSRGPACTLTVDGLPLLSVGIIDCRNGDGEVWAVIDRTRRYKHPLLITRAVKKAIDIACISMNLSSAHMFVQCARIDAARWAMALGFAEIGKLTIYNQPEQDHFIFSRSL
jgi:hypothetical protein